MNTEEAAPDGIYRARKGAKQVRQKGGRFGSKLEVSVMSLASVVL